MFDFPLNPASGTVVMVPDGSYRVWDSTKWRASPSSSTITTGPFLPIAGGVMTGALSLFGNATGALHAVPLQQLNAATGGNGPFLPLTGGTVSGPLTLAGNATSTLHAVPLQQLTAATAGGPFLPLATGGTVSGPTTILHDVAFTPATGGTIGLAISGNYSGTMGAVGGVAPLEILLNDNVDSSGNPGSSFFAQAIQHNFGGTNGGHGSINIRMQQTANVLDAGPFINPLFVQLFANYSGGGSGNAIASAANCNVGGTGWGLAEGEEIGISLAAGASVQQAYVGTYIWDAAQHATAFDAIHAYSAVGGSGVGARALWQVGRNGDQWPLDPAGWLLTTVQQINQNPGNTQRWPQACAGGFDLSKVNFSTAAWRSSGVSIEAATVRVGTATIAANSLGLIIDASTGTIGTIASVASGGAGYQLYDQLYDGNGGIISATAVSGGVITSAAYVFGREPYKAGGAGPSVVTTTGGSGNGAATFNVTWAARTQIQFPTQVVVGDTVTMLNGLVVSNNEATFNSGINFGANAVAAPLDFSKHISLHSAGYGFTVTAGQLNVGVGNVAAAFFTSSGFTTGTVQIGGATGPTWTTGSGVPSSTQPVGSLYSRVSTWAAGATLYVSKGAGAWTAVASV